MGALVGKPCERPETVVGDYDIVLAKGRTALEALATGASVILYLRRAIGPLVTDGELERLLPLNFGIRAMTRLFDPVEFAQALSVELARYDSQDAAHVSRRIRAMCGRDRAADEFLSLYNGVIAEYGDGSAPDADAEGLAAADYLRELLLGIKEEREAFYKSNTFRFKERLLRLPLLGKMSRPLAQRLAGRTTRRS
ncbi:MAG: hypothetical protein QOC61_2318 [Acidobacteriota bacterium]|jgi:hypothetical protein|nr:hypothetical protein [Acidobacteriota bacterium]